MSKHTPRSPSRKKHCGGARTLAHVRALKNSERAFIISHDASEHKLISDHLGPLRITIVGRPKRKGEIKLHYFIKGKINLLNKYISRCLRFSGSRMKVFKLFFSCKRNPSSETSIDYDISTYFKLKQHTKRICWHNAIWWWLLHSWVSESTSWHWLISKHMCYR